MIIQHVFRINLVCSRILCQKIQQNCVVHKRAIIGSKIMKFNCDNHCEWVCHSHELWNLEIGQHNSYYVRSYKNDTNIWVCSNIHSLLKNCWLFSALDFIQLKIWVYEIHLAFVIITARDSGRKMHIEG